VGKVLNSLLRELHRAGHPTIGGLAAIRTEAAVQFGRAIETSELRNGCLMLRMNGFGKDESHFVFLLPTNEVSLDRFARGTRITPALMPKPNARARRIFLSAYCKPISGLCD
jgi:hypothetical protein